MAVSVNWDFDNHPCKVVEPSLFHNSKRLVTCRSIPQFFEYVFNAAIAASKFDAGSSSARHSSSKLSSTPSCRLTTPSSCNSFVIGSNALRRCSLSSARPQYLRCLKVPCAHAHRFGCSEKASSKSSMLSASWRLAVRSLRGPQHMSSLCAEELLPSRSHACASQAILSEQLLTSERLLLGRVGV